MTVDADTTLLITRIFDVPRERVFDAWLTREEWQAWIGPEGVSCDVTRLEARVGGRYHIDMHMPDGAVLPVSGAFKLIDRPNTLSFTWGADGDPSRQSLVTLTFKDIGGGTEFTLHQVGFSAAVERDQFGQGWNSALNKLQNHLDRKQTQ